MTLSRAVGAILVLATLDQAARGMSDVRVARFAPWVTALQALCLALALLLVVMVARGAQRTHWWHVLLASGCLAGLVERVFFGSISLPFSLAASGVWDWTAFAFADMYIAAGLVAAYWKYEFKREQRGENAGKGDCSASKDQRV